MSNALYILVMAGVSFLIRVVPLTLLRRPVRNRFIRSFLYYVPYVTLAVMTFPAIMQTTGSPWPGLAALTVGIVLAWKKCGLFPVAVACSAVTLILEWIVQGGFI